MHDITPIGPQADWPTDQILRKASDQEFDSVVVIGWLKKPGDDGKHFWLSSSYGDSADVIYAIRCADHFMMKQVFQED